MLKDILLKILTFLTRSKNNPPDDLGKQGGVDSSCDKKDTEIKGAIMQVTSQAIEIIKKFEGFRPKPYLDAVGIPTIGYGTTIYPDGSKVKITDRSVTPDEAELFVVSACKKIISAIAPSIKVQLTQNQCDAIISFVYNVGVSNFKNSTMLKLLNQGDYVGAANQFDRWVKAGGKVLPGLVSRRKAEKELFLKPDLFV